MNLSHIDTFVLLVYFAAMAALAVWFGKRQNSTEEYFVGGRQFSGWVIGLSLVGTSISSVTFLAYPADAYKTAWLRYIPNLMLPLAVWIAMLTCLPKFRKLGITTTYEFLDQRFGKSVGSYAAIAFIIAQLVRISTILYLLALLIEQVTGLSVVSSIVIAGIFVGTYTLIGGFDAVVWTDVIQTVILALGGVICLGVIIHLLPGGLGQILEVATTDNKLTFHQLTDGELTPTPWSFSFQEKTVSMILFLGLIQWLTEYSANQNTVQRFCAVKSEREAKKALWFCAGFSLPIWAFYMFLGTALYVFFQVFPQPLSNAILDGSQKAESILPFFINQFLPVGVAGLVIAAALSAAMSSLDSSINAIATVTTVNFIKRIKPQWTDAQYLKSAKVVTFLTIVWMIAGAVYLVYTETKTLQDFLTIVASVLGGGLLGLYIIGLFTKIESLLAVWLGIGCTVLFTIWTLLSGRDLIPERWQVPFDLYYTAIFANLLMVLVIWVGFTVVIRVAAQLRNGR